MSGVPHLLLPLEPLIELHRRIDQPRCGPRQDGLVDCSTPVILKTGLFKLNKG